MIVKSLQKVNFLKYVLIFARCPLAVKGKLYDPKLQTILQHDALSPIFSSLKIVAASWEVQ